jgi:ABC-2 type transport system permease protein
MKARLSTIWTIARRDLSMRARSKAFRISSVILLVSVVLGIVVPTLVLGRSTAYTVVVVDAAGVPPPALVASGAEATGLDLTIVEVADRGSAVGQVEAGTADAAVAVNEIIWRDRENAQLAPVLNSAVAQATVTGRARALGVSPEELASLFAPATPTVTLLRPQPDRGPQTVIAMVGMILLFVAINFYGAYVLTGVVEEKSGRVVEVLLARVRPADLLAGKVLGIGLLGLVQFLSLGVVAAATLQIVQPPDVPAGTVPLIGVVVLWFVLGYGFYSVLYGALGSLASRTEDAQAATAPLTGVMLLAYFGAFSAIANPTAWWVTAGSMFPLTAPTFMPLRAGLTDVPYWQMAAAILIMVAAIVVTVQVGGRLYRGALLHTAGRLRVRQAWRLAK